jgi:hypothetical protein
MIREGKINCRNNSKFVFNLDIRGTLNGTALVYLRLWSGTKRYCDASCIVPGGVKNQLCADLKNWKMRRKITRVEILLRPNGPGWESSTTARISLIGIRK